jgi:hypothetical protein
MELSLCVRENISGCWLGDSEYVPLEFLVEDSCRIARISVVPKIVVAGSIRMPVLILPCREHGREPAIPLNHLVIASDIVNQFTRIEVIPVFLDDTIGGSTGSRLPTRISSSY